MSLDRVGPEGPTCPVGASPCVPPFGAGPGTIHTQRFEFWSLAFTDVHLPGPVRVDLTASEDEPLEWFRMADPAGTPSAYLFEFEAELRVWTTINGATTYREVALPYIYALADGFSDPNPCPNGCGGGLHAPDDPVACSPVTNDARSESEDGPTDIPPELNLDNTFVCAEGIGVEIE